MLSKLSIGVLRGFEGPTSSRKGWGDGASRFNFWGVSIKETPFLFLILAVACLILSLIRL